MRAVIAAGGRGSRLASVSGELPKAMVSICGVPIIERQINSLVTSGIDEIMITVGYRADAIIERIGDGSRLGARVEYFKEESPLGSAGALASLKEWIETDFLLLLGDLVLDVDFTRFIKYHREKQARATLFVHPNSHPFDSDLVIIGESGNVTGWMSKRDTRPFSYRNIVNAGIYMLNRESIASLVK
ncbi:MAG: nucleotidyltransferase family protein, partial [Oscillospiraceae bacterium]